MVDGIVEYLEQLGWQCSRLASYKTRHTRRLGGDSLYNPLSMACQRFTDFDPLPEMTDLVKNKKTGSWLVEIPDMHPVFIVP